MIFSTKPNTKSFFIRDRLFYFMVKKLKWTLLHIGISVSVTVFFAYFFQLSWVPKWIQENIVLVPDGQMLSYGVYFGGCLFVLTNKILIKPKHRLELKLSNIMIVIGRVLNLYTTMFIDLVAITVITFTFFSVGYDLDAESELFLATFCGIFVFPPLALYTSWAFSKQKLEYVAPIFSNKKRNRNF